VTSDKSKGINCKYTEQQKCEVDLNAEDAEDDEKRAANEDDVSNWTQR